MTPSESLPNLDRAVSRFAFKITLASGATLALTYITLWLFVWGLGVLVSRAAWTASPSKLMWGAAGILPAALVAALAALRRTPDRSALRALLDQRNRCGGLLMAAEQVELGAWQRTLPVVAAPRLRWRGRRWFALLAAGLVFLTASFIVPVRLSGTGSSRPLDLAGQADQLAAAVETLKAEEVIDQSSAESFEQKLESIQQDASGDDPARTWEALDHLEQTISETAEEASEKIAQTAQQLAQAEALAKAMSEGGSSSDPKLVTEAMKELASLADSAQGEMSNEMMEGLKSGSLDREQLKQLAEALGARKGELAKRLGRLRDAGLIDLAQYKKCEKAGECDSAGLADFLAKNAESMSVKEMMGAWGRGGIDRGRGDAPMTWSEGGASEQGAKFKEQVLPPSALAGLKDSQLVGRSSGAPTADRSNPSSSGALSGAAAGGGSAFTHTVLPRHKGAVKRYFER